MCGVVRYIKREREHTYKWRVVIFVRWIFIIWVKKKTINKSKKEKQNKIVI